jgi:pantoate--beta-alanine ligase
MQVINDAATLQALLKPLKQSGKSIGFVPTMGNLHAGHLSLVEAAKQDCDITVSSIFVNPAQFGANEDLDTYPRTFKEDCEKLEKLNTDIVFAPDSASMYPDDVAQHTLVKIPHLSSQLCGVTRPVFFQGITTVVCKLFNIVQADIAFFGEKDYQQLMCIKKMVQDLHIPVIVKGLPTVREASGLAMSSRNNYLSAEQKQQAACLQQQLQWLREQVQNGAVNYPELEQQVKEKLNEEGFQPDYISVRRQIDLALPSSEDRDLIALGAAMLGKTRLIDNVLFKRG